MEFRYCKICKSTIELQVELFLSKKDECLVCQYVDSKNKVIVSETINILNKIRNYIEHNDTDKNDKNEINILLNKIKCRYNI